MNSSLTRWLGQSWRPILLVAAVYLYFLIFSQFGFLHRVSDVVGGDSQDVVLGIMGIAGILGALISGIRYRAERIRIFLGSGFVGSAASAWAVEESHSLMAFAVAAAVSGFSLGALTVVVVGFLHDFCSKARIGLLCGLGTGLAYFVSNLPFVFNASPANHCRVAAVVSLGGLAVLALSPLATMMQPLETSPEKSRARGWALAPFVVVFLVLIWMDSAAFSQIQETPDLKAASWSGEGNLWCIGVTHGLAAVVAGVLLDRGRFRWVVGLAFLGLGAGYLLLGAHEFGLLPSLVYAAAVSFYSTALVAFALTERTGFRVTVAVGLVYGVSGWLGSAMGIGMAQHLGRVPVSSWMIAAVLLFPILVVSRLRKAAR
ncbi:hypothetical protein [Puniceicoccus vermicola]|uniref:MFS transporter n=1 Tax=Puniceicoccus vermicola TaxID=388746 RepID=A0A7X1B1M7_9BACT|nr:hypothetical protein [Puniceicoccus vermicola]MBC2603961.1 hypothetical protein [Puniceicoccus vermicola]